MSGHGQTLHDRLTAARHTLAGQGLARIVCKATTEEIIGPKKKHLDYLLHCTNEPNVSIPQLANLLIERTQHSSWVVVFKALITVHHLMCYGNERFTQYLASNNCTFQLSNFLDKSSVQSAYDMSTFIRRYAKYLNEKALSYRTVAFDFCKVKRGKEDGMLRTMNTDKLLKTVPVLQSQLDSLLEFDCTANDLTNGVINSCFMLLFRDLIRLFACYNDGIINLLEKYFDMNKKNCRDALDIYKKFLIRMDRVAEFLKVAENVGIDKGDIPDLTKAPSSLLDALEQHLASVEGKKGVTVTSPAARSSNLKNAVSALSSISNSFGNVAANGTSLMQDVNGIRVDETTRKALEEEATAMNQLKFDADSPHNNWEQPSWDNVERRMREMQTQPSIDSTTGSVKTNPFLTSPSADVLQTNDKIVDLFSAPVSTQAVGKASEDLLCLSGNPFADSIYGGGGSAPVPQQHQQQQPIPSFMAFGTNGFQTQNAARGFAGENSFAAAFGNNSTSDNAAVFTDSNALIFTQPAGTGVTSTLPAPASPEKGGVVDSLSLPVVDPFAARSTSPSPTADIMKGAGTTPILTHAPDNVFGDAGDESATDVAWGPPVAEPSPFGAPFEPCFPPAGAAQQQADWFGGLESGTEMPKPKNPALVSGFSAPPPSPFGGIDMESAPDVGGTGDPAFTVGAQQQKPVSAFDDLNFAIQKAMQGPKPPAGVSSSLPGPRPVFSQAIPPQSMGSVSPGMGPSSSSLSRLDALAVGGVPHASPSSGYGTPPSGMSSPAKSVAGFGVTGTGFDAFGDVLQPTQAMGGAVGKAVNGVDSKNAGTSLIKGDLDSSLASLALNLNINGPKHSIKKPGGHQWGSPKVATKTGGANWAQAGQAPNVNWNPNQQQFPSAGSGGQQWNSGGMMAGPFPQQPSPQPGAMTGLPQQQFPMRPMAPAGMGMGMGVGMGVTSNQQQQPMGMFMGQRPPGGSTQPSTAINDPFGAL